MIPQDIKIKIHNHRVISFDIFDTLLIRPYARPQDMFKHIEKCENQEGFYEARIFAEENARKYNPEKEEVTLSDIYEKIDPQYLFLKEKEIQFETKILHINPKVKEIYDYALSLNKTIIAISDMYLSEKTLEQILREKGYSGIKKVYVSSEFGLSKKTGTLYQKVLQNLDITADTILHIGDNMVADIEQAQKNGIDTYHVPKLIDSFFKNNERAANYYNENSSSLNVSVLMGLLAYMEVLPEMSYWKKFGFLYGGPIIFSYMSWLYRQLKKEKIFDVLFMARDGYTLEKVFKQLDIQKQFKTSYVYASRALDTLINLNYKVASDENPLSEGLSRIKKIIYYYQDQNPILKKDTPQNINTPEEGIKFIESHLPIYQKLANSKKEDYKRYIQKYLSSAKIALVDTLSIHFSSQKFLASFIKEKMLKGFYWIYTLSENKAYLKCEAESFAFTHKVPFVDWHIMELIMSAPELPIWDLKNGKPVYREENEEEKYRKSIYPEISDGAVLFSKVAQDMMGNVPVLFTETEMRNWINSFCLIYQEEDAKMFKKVKHGCDSNHTKYKMILKGWYKKYTNRYKFLGFPFLKIVRQGKKIELILLKWMHILKKNIGEDVVFYFWNIPILHIQRKAHKKKLKICGIPVLISKTKIKETKERRKLYFLGLPVGTVERDLD